MMRLLNTASWKRKETGMWTDNLGIYTNLLYLKYAYVLSNDEYGIYFHGTEQLVALRTFTELHTPELRSYFL